MTKTFYRHTGEADARHKEKGHAEAQPTSETTEHDFSTENEREPVRLIDPLVGWHELGKPARLNRKAKRTWRRKAGGAVQGEVLALLILATVVGLLLVGVVR